MKYWLKGLMLLVLFYFNQEVHAQTISGKVYELDSKLPLEGVAIRNLTKNAGELTDRYGFYSLEAKNGDSIDVFLVGYVRRRYVVVGVNNQFKQNFYLNVEKFALPEVQVMARKNTRRDSLENRADNASIFDYKRPSTAATIVGSLFHPLSGIQYLANTGQRKRLRRFQDRLINDEQDRYIESRFSREEITSMTGLEGQELENFMQLYKPTYEFVKASSDYDILDYIKRSYDSYKNLSTAQKDSLGEKNRVPAFTGKDTTEDYKP